MDYFHCEKNHLEIDNALVASDRSYNAVVKNCPDAIQSITASSGKNQLRVAKLLDSRAKEVASWRGDIQALVSQIREEIGLLNNLLEQVRCALTTLQVTEGINSECISRRISHNSYTYLAEEEILWKRIRDALNLATKEIESEIEKLSLVKVQLEYNWSDKNEVVRLETLALGLTKKEAVSFYPGAARFVANQPTPEQWAHFTQEEVTVGRAMLERSAALRMQTRKTLDQASCDLRFQADAIDMAFRQHVANSERSLQHTEKELDRVLGQITHLEAFPDKLRQVLRELDLHTKVSQSRQGCRAARLRIENIRDELQDELLKEIVQLTENSSTLRKHSDAVNKTLELLNKSRALLEDEIAEKRRSIYDDRERCLFYRSKFPDTASLSGF